MKKFLAILLAAMMIMSVSSLTVSAWTDGPGIKAVNATTWDKSEGYPYNAFDNSAQGVFWHSAWSGAAGGKPLADGPQSIVVELDGVYKIDCLGYLPRTNAGNGSAEVWEVWVSTVGSINDCGDNKSDGPDLEETGTSWTKVASGEWFDWDGANNGNEFRVIEFDAVDAKLVKFTILEGRDDWANAAAIELGFVGVAYTPREGFTPRTAPGTGASAVETPAVETPVVTPSTASPTPAPTTGNMSIIIALAVFAATAFITVKMTRAKNRA